MTNLLRQKCLSSSNCQAFSCSSLVCRSFQPVPGICRSLTSPISLDLILRPCCTTFGSLVYGSTGRSFREHSLVLHGQVAIAIVGFVNLKSRGWSIRDRGRDRGSLRLRLCHHNKRCSSCRRRRCMTSGSCTKRSLERTRFVGYRMSHFGVEDSSPSLWGTSSGHLFLSKTCGTETIVVGHSEREAMVLLKIISAA